MRILIIRHGDPDYEHDTLTLQGEKEAILLAEFVSNYKIDALFCSPLGRAKKTCSYIEDKLNLKATVLPWLKEFDGKISIDGSSNHVFWDFLPSHFNENPELYDNSSWSKSPLINNPDVFKKYDLVVSSIDELLKEFGYERENNTYKVNESNTKTIAFVCHFGLESMLLSHLLNASPFTFSQHFCAAPTAMTTLYTEERRKGIAQFRCTEYGSVAHLYAKNEKPSFSARFCETFDLDQRHD